MTSKPAALLPKLGLRTQDKSQAVEAAEQRVTTAAQDVAAAQSRVAQAEATAQAKLKASSDAAEEAATQAAAVAARMRDVEDRERAARAAQDELAQGRAELGAKLAEVKSAMAAAQKGRRRCRPQTTLYIIGCQMGTVFRASSTWLRILPNLKSGSFSAPGGAAVCPHPAC
jgi:uncharacterized protein (DUF3084 family)